MSQNPKPPQQTLRDLAALLARDTNMLRQFLADEVRAATDSDSADQVDRHQGQDECPH